MKGFVETPTDTVDLMVDKLFRDHPPSARSVVLDPGCGKGAFIEGLLRWCRTNGKAQPKIIGVDSDPRHIEFCRRRFEDLPDLELREGDFLDAIDESYDFIIGNPPYVPITGLSVQERDTYRRHFLTAAGRFDLYLLFFEQGLRHLRPDGRLVFITPEKFLYVRSAEPLRRLMTRMDIEELHFLDERTFGDLVTYPLVTTVRHCQARMRTRVIHRDKKEATAALRTDGASWLPQLRGTSHVASRVTLQAICSRISCGVATGADAVFVVRNSQLTASLRPFAHPTLSGREIVGTDLPSNSRSMLIPYDREGQLIPEELLGELGRYLANPGHKERLLARTCVRRKPWYAFHETPPLDDVLRPKLLCKDIGARPLFVIDAEGTLVPRHSVYYIVPRYPSILAELGAYLNGPIAQDWLRDHCQRAANGFLRLQSHVLKQLPVPHHFAPEQSGDLFEMPDAELLPA